MPDAPAAVVAETVDVPTRDGTADALFCHPDAGGPHPGVLLYMDAYGIRPAVEAHARRLAGHGYCVFVPNVFEEKPQQCLEKVLIVPFVVKLDGCFATSLDENELLRDLLNNLHRIQPCTRKANDARRGCSLDRAIYQF